MIRLYQIAELITNDHYIFKKLSESVAQKALWICGPNNVTEYVPQNSLYQNLTNQYGLLNGIASHQ